MLLITSEGIVCHDVPAIGNTFLSWGEVSSLAVVPVHQSYGKPIYHLCLTPKDSVRFLSRFHPLRRILIRFGSVATGSLIPLPQWFLSEPVEEVLIQIQETFQEEIRRHEVAIVRSPSEKESF